MKSFREFIWWDTFLDSWSILGNVMYMTMTMLRCMELAVNHSEPEVRSTSAREVASMIGLLYAGMLGTAKHVERD